MGYTLMPYAKINGKWTLPDDLLKWVWYQMVDQNRANQTFYDGCVQTAQEFIAFMQDPRNMPVFLFSEGYRDVLMVAWLNTIQNRQAQCHFCCIGKYKRGMAETILEYWSRFKHADKRPLFLVIVGVTPETHTSALKLLKIVGLKTIGSIPNACFIAAQGEYVPGVISYFCPEEFLKEV